MSAQFDKAVSIVRSLPPDGSVKPTQDQQLEFYGLFKQATEGDVKGDRPGAFNFAGKYKWDAWKKLEGMSQDEAKAKYVALLKGVSVNSIRLGGERACSEGKPFPPSFSLLHPPSQTLAKRRADSFH